LTGRITIKKLKVKVTRFFSEKTGKKADLTAEKEEAKKRLQQVKCFKRKG